MKLIREFSSLPRPKKVIVGIVATVLGAVISVAMDMSLGFTFDQAINHLALVGVSSLLFGLGYAIILRLKAKL